MIRKTIFISLFMLGAGVLYAQEQSWTLQQCIDYAIENNITVQQMRISSENKEINLNTAQNSRLPSVSASLGQSVYFGRGPSRDGTYTDNNQTSTSMGVSANLPLFQGMRIKHEIAGRTADFQASLEDFSRAREDVSLNVTSIYLQVLLNKELVKVAENQVALSSEQVRRSELLVQSGKSPESELFESRAVLAKDEMNLTQNKNTLMLSLLDLRQALNIETDNGFDIKDPNIGAETIEDMGGLKNPDAVYDYAVENRPRILAEKLRLQSSEKDLLIAKSARYPSISLSGGYSNSYYYSFVSGYNNKLFFEQLKNNGNEYVGLNINIPIFNRLATRNSIRTAQNNIRIQELAVTEAQQVLKKEIEQSYYNATAAFEKYRSAVKSLEAARLAFRYEEDKADVGRSTIFDYNDAKTRMEKSESDMAQAKYEFIFRQKILNFYAGEKLEFKNY